MKNGILRFILVIGIAIIMGLLVEWFGISFIAFLLGAVSLIFLWFGFIFISLHPFIQHVNQATLQYEENRDVEAYLNALRFHQQNRLIRFSH